MLLKRSKYRFLFLAPALCLFLSALPSGATEVIVIGDTQLKPVVDIVSGIRETLESPVTVYSPSDVKGRLDAIAAKEGARIVIALGKDAIDDAVQLPPSIAVIFDLVIIPPKINRPNTTGLFMATPVSEYVNLINKYLPSMKKISVVSSQSLLKTLSADQSQISAFRVNSSFELVNTIKKLDGTDALLLLPDVSLLTATAIEEIYLYSFRKKIPILGISDKHVKQGALLALVFDPESVGKQLGGIALEAGKGVDIGKINPSPSRLFDLYINTETARKMGIEIPEEMLDRAKKVYP